MSRFDAVRRLYGDDVQKLASAHVLVVGLGGVGSWTVEALARTGIGRITLLDGDDVCVSNTNRQLHALQETVGRPKVEVVSERVRSINPSAQVTAIAEFFRKTTVEQHLAVPYDAVVDAVDGVSAKAHIIAGCRARGIPVVTCGGAGGKVDPARVEVADLSETRDDPLLVHVRKLLRTRLDFPRGRRKFGVPCVYSTEPIRQPDACAPDADGRLTCEGRLGSVSHVTGVFGLFVASEIIKAILRKSAENSPPPAS